MTGIVTEVKYTDTDSELLYSIKVKTNIGSGKSQVERIVFPLDTNVKRTPVVGEMVYLVPRVSSDSSLQLQVNQNYIIQVQYRYRRM